MKKNLYFLQNNNKDLEVIENRDEVFKDKFKLWQ